MERLLIKRPDPRMAAQKRLMLLLASTAISTPFLFASAFAGNLPTGGSVAAGGATINSTSPTQMNIVQTSQSAVLNWQSFSIGQGYTVNFQQPSSSSAILNRVTGNTPSMIAGTLTANGQVYLVNPNGIAITKSGVVDTGGGFVASTLGISDSNFMAGNRTFTGNGSSAAVTNDGVITVGRGGYTALMGGTVANSGYISVPLGKVAIGSGEVATLDFSGDGFLQVGVPTTAGGTTALIQNSGKIKANGGSIIISAATAREAARNAINMSGVVQARTISGHNGSIVLGGGSGGSVKISGKIDAKGKKGSGGSIVVTGKDITLASVSLDASGLAGGGTINIGGSQQGKGPLLNADTVSIDKSSTIDASAKTSGNGGDIVVWSDGATSFDGTILAQGGTLNGNGGNAEVSSHGLLNYTGFANLSAINGKYGTLLLDPYNVTISSGTNNTGGSFTANTNDSIINTETLDTALGSANVTITTGSSGSQSGNITVADNVAWSAATTLTLNAANAININAPININGSGGLSLTATNQPGISTTGVTFGNGASVIYAGAGSIGGQTLSINGNSYTLVYTMAQLDAIDGLNAVDNSSVTTYGVGLAGNYALANNLNAAGTTYTQALIGTNSSNSSTTQYSGNFDGVGHTITDLTITAPTLINVGFFGYTATGSTISSVGVINDIIIGNSHVGGLIGHNHSTVQTSYATGSVTGVFNTGGLIGYGTSNGTVQSSYATGSVTGVNNTGGLLGSNDSTVQTSYATASVNGAGSGTGGLIGYTAVNTMVQTSYATGSVTGIGYTGGLIGNSAGAVTDTYATGNVTGSSWYTGGLIGFTERMVQTSYATGSVTGNRYTGGLMGGSTATVQTSYATGSVTGEEYVGGLVGIFFGTVQSSYSTGSVTGTNYTGGLVGFNQGGTVQTSYATGGVTGETAVGGLVGYNSSVVQSSYASGAVTNNCSVCFDTGGLVGFNHGIVRTSYSQSNVTGFQNVGGLVGTNDYGSLTLVQNSYATGNITGTGAVGGLVGFNGSKVQNSYATGNVLGGISNSSNRFIGGLVGSNISNDSAVFSSYATGSVTGFQIVGGLVGLNQGNVRESFANGNVTAIGFGSGGLVGGNEATIVGSYSTGRATGVGSTGGLVGDNSGIILSSYWDKQASGNLTSVGGAGLTTAQMQDLSNFQTTYAGFDFQNVWSPPNQAGQGGQVSANYPKLYALTPVVWSDVNRAMVESW